MAALTRSEQQPIDRSTAQPDTGWPIQQLIRDNRLLLMEAAIVEQLRRNSDIKLHPQLLNAPLIYDAQGRRELSGLYRRYWEIALAADLPFMMCTPTWRANRERVEHAGVNPSINGDAVFYLRSLRDAWDTAEGRVMIGGMIGCKNDCYQPAAALSSGEATRFHAWQIDRLAAAGVDFLIAETLPSVAEANGIAHAMAGTGLPYIISFVIDRHGRVLDGSSLTAAMASIDAGAFRPPLGYMVNCAHPGFLRADSQPPGLFGRLVGYQANASSLDHCDLDGASELQADDVADWGRLMRGLNRNFGVKILGGCCGTGVEHLRALIDD